MAGSSPRVRGTVACAKDIPVTARFIPACAGNGPVHPYEVYTPAVHPRVCGERSGRCGVHGSTLGSSPRVRGTDVVRFPGNAGIRFIPACAGNGVRDIGVRPSTPVHPRVCGERCDYLLIVGDPIGSSPRVRGTVTGFTNQPEPPRFIPACAGNGTNRGRKCSVWPVHPRVCGERERLTAQECLQIGSSPRVRGTDDDNDDNNDDHEGERFIPACAGNGQRHPLHGPDYSVHPRVCGERLTTAKLISRRVGSSPRVRGTDDPAD